MPNFKDSLDRNWSIDVNYDSIKSLRKELNIDLLSVCDPGSTLMQRFASDEVLLVDVVSVLCTDQMRERSIDAAGFAKGMLGLGLQNAVDALVQGIADFSRPQKGALIRKMWEKMTAVETHASNRINQAMDDPQLMTRVDAMLDSALEKLTN